METRLLQEQLLEKEQQKFKLGVSSVNDLIALQRTLAAARVSEVAALSVYSHAHISLDQVVGETLENNNVVTADALEGAEWPARIEVAARGREVTGVQNAGVR